MISVHLMVGYSCPGEIIVIRLVTRLNYSVMGFELVRLYSLLSPVGGVAKNQGRNLGGGGVALRTPFLYFKLGHISK